MIVRSGSTRVEACTFRSNRAGSGATGEAGSPGQNGGLFSPPTGGGQGGIGWSGGFGGAVYVPSDGRPTFVNCFFHDNQSGAGGRGGQGGRGGNGIILQNGANGGSGGRGGQAGLGGAVFAEPHARPRFVNCTFVNNRLGAPGSGGAGGAGGTGGAGASNGSTGPSGGTGLPGEGGGMYCWLFPGQPAQVELKNSIVWGNDSPQLFGTIVSHSNVQGWWPGTGNIDADPLLSGAKLLPGSPCIDAGSDLSLPAGTTADAEGHPRRFDHPLVPSLQAGSIVDMGCDEFSAPFVLPFGCGPNASVRLLTGTPTPGSTMTFMVRDRDERFGARAALLVGTARDPAPCGTSTPGGALLVDLSQPHSLVLGGDVGQQLIALHLPPDPSLIGESLFVQGATILPHVARQPRRFPTWSLLGAIELVVGAADAVPVGETRATLP